MAYFIGSTPSPINVEPDDGYAMTHSSEAEGVSSQTAELDLLMALPFAALMISPLSRIQLINQKALKVLGIPNPIGQLAKTVLRQPDLHAATMRVSQSGAPEQLEYTLHADAETWMAHIQAGSRAGSVVVIFEDRTEVPPSRPVLTSQYKAMVRTPLTASLVRENHARTARRQRCTG